MLCSYLLIVVGAFHMYCNFLFYYSSVIFGPSSNKSSSSSSLCVYFGPPPLAIDNTSAFVFIIYIYIVRLMTWYFTNAHI